jgi:hypothetical protein
VTTERDKAVPEGVAQYARRVDAGSSLWYLGNLFTILAGSEETEGRFALIEILAQGHTAVALAPQSGRQVDLDK